MELTTKSGARRCWANNHAGSQCGAIAMKGTDPPRCRIHCGRRPADVHRDAVLEERAAKAGALLVARGDVEPTEDALEEMLDVATDMKVFHAGLKSLVGDLKAMRYRAGAGEQLRAEVAAYERSLDRRAKALADIVRLGIEDRLVRVEEAKAAAVVETIKRVLALHGLNPANNEIAGQVAVELRAAEKREAAPLVVLPGRSR